MMFFLADLWLVYSLICNSLVTCALLRMLYRKIMK